MLFLLIVLIFILAPITDKMGFKSQSEQWFGIFAIILLLLIVAIGMGSCTA